MWELHHLHSTHAMVFVYERKQKVTGEMKDLGEPKQLWTSACTNWTDWLENLEDANFFLWCDKAIFDFFMKTNKTEPKINMFYQ